jgi:UrcA family protein
MTRSFFLAAAACAALAGAAHAEQQVSVSTKGLDLSTQAGAKAFYSRLSHAVIDACGGAPTSFFTSDEERFQTCYKTAMDQAVSQAHAPLVAALHAGKPARPTALASR